MPRRHAQLPRYGTEYPSGAGEAAAETRPQIRPATTSELHQGPHPSPRRPNTLPLRVTHFRSVWRTSALRACSPRPCRSRHAPRGSSPPAPAESRAVALSCHFVGGCRGCGPWLLVWLRRCPQRRLGAILKGVLICLKAAVPQPCFNPLCPVMEVPVSRWAVVEEAHGPLPEELWGRVACGPSLSPGGGNVIFLDRCPRRRGRRAASCTHGRPAEPLGEGRAVGRLPGFPPSWAGLGRAGGAALRPCSSRSVTFNVRGSGFLS